MLHRNKLTRKKRLAKANIKRQGWHHINSDGYRSNLWRDYKTKYVQGLPDFVACHYCGFSMPKHKITLDHKDGREGYKLTDPNNIVVACFKCNSEKGSTPYESFVAQKKK